MTTAAERYDFLSREVKTVSVGILDHEIPANPKWTILLDSDFDWVIHLFPLKFYITALYFCQYIDKNEKNSFID